MDAIGGNAQPARAVDTAFEKAQAEEAKVPQRALAFGVPLE